MESDGKIKYLYLVILFCVLILGTYLKKDMGFKPEKKSRLVEVNLSDSTGTGDSLRLVND